MTPDIEQVLSYTEHDIMCVRRTWHAGRPTASGGYETMFGDKWYQSKPVNEEPKCDCGLDELIERIING